MTAAYRLKGLGWFGSCVGVVLAFYLVSLQVATERKALDQVDGRIRAAQRDIRALETEFDTRANLAQLERWNGDALALAAPTAGQFVSNAGQLAALDVNAGPGAGGTVETAALVVPSAPPIAAAPLPPAVTVAVAPAASAPASKPAAAPKVDNAPAMRAAAVQMASVATRPQVIRAAALHTPHGERAVASRSHAAKGPAMAMLDRKLLSDSTLGDILSGARAEAGHRR